MEHTVVAAATPWGRAALGVVRLSGEDCEEVINRFVLPLGEAGFAPGRVRRAAFFDAAGVFDDGTIALGRAPRTFTGEHTAELTCHGNPLIMRRLLDAAVAAGARVASPGDFTRRAFMHGKMDLIGAEAVLQVSEARTEQGLSVARAAMDGRLGAFLAEQRGALIGLAAELEARLDYPADELALVGDEALVSQLRLVASRCASLAETSSAGRVWVHGARVALVGAVNAGKSSLFNALLGSTRALVHATPGTTRDVVEATCEIEGLAVTLMDTAGERITNDPVEAAGHALAAELVATADLVVVVLRAREGGLSDVEREIVERTAARPSLLIYNGVDLPGHAASPPGAVATIATRGEGLGAVRAALGAALVGETARETSLVIASHRQSDRLHAVSRLIEEAVVALEPAGVAVAAALVTDAIEVLDEVTGADTREDILDGLFSRFCIGK